MRSSLNLNKINRSFDGLRDSIKRASDISESISTNLDESIKVDRQRISMSSKMFARKRSSKYFATNIVWLKIFKYREAKDYTLRLKTREYLV